MLRPCHRLRLIRQSRPRIAPSPRRKDRRFKRRTTPSIIGANEDAAHRHATSKARWVTRSRALPLRCTGLHLKAPDTLLALGESAPGLLARYEKKPPAGGFFLAGVAMCYSTAMAPTGQVSTHTSQSMQSSSLTFATPSTMEMAPTAHSSLQASQPVHSSTFTFAGITVPLC